MGAEEEEEEEEEEAIARILGVIAAARRAPTRSRPDGGNVQLGVGRILPLVVTCACMFAALMAQIFVIKLRKVILGKRTGGTMSCGIQRSILIVCISKCPSLRPSICDYLG